MKEERKRKKYLTRTGLLMEGVYTNNRITGEMAMYAN
jgi:hypothetical protein